jgi:hypothetical protein
MRLGQKSWLGLTLSIAAGYACSPTDDPNYVDSGSPIVVAGGLTAGGGMVGGGATTGGTAAGGTGGVQATPGTGGLAGGVKPGGSTAGGGIGSAMVGGTTVGGGLSGAGDAGVPGGASDSGVIAGDGGTTPSTGGTCPGLPAVTNYDQMGPFDVTIQADVVTGGEGCSLYRPGSSLGKDGFKHPVAVWGNGITTRHTSYRSTLSLFASHGFVVIACNSANPERPCLNACMEWLVKQNESGDMAGKLDLTKEFTLGYSWGGGAAIDTADRPNVKGTVSFHGMPPRNDPWAKMKAPLLLFTSTGDTFVSASGYVTPNYNSSQVATFYATLQESVSHTYIMDTGGGAAKQKGPAVAWMRYWACGDENAKKYFFGSECTLCKSPFKAQMKPMDAWQ